MAFSKLHSIVAMAFVFTVFNGGSVRAQTPAMAPSLAPTTTSAPSMAPETFQPMAPGPSPDCFTVLLNMSDCLSYVEEGSNVTVPEKGCCGELAGLVEGSPICLCQLLSNPGQTGLSIDVSKALNLPSVCGVSTPPVSTCAVFGYPVGEPTASELAPGAPPAQESSPPTSTSGRDGGGASTMFGITSLASLVLCLALASLPTLG